MWRCHPLESFNICMDVRQKNQRLQYGVNLKHTVDASNIQDSPVEVSSWNPIIYQALGYIQTVVGLALGFLSIFRQANARFRKSRGVYLRWWVRAEYVPEIAWIWRYKKMEANSLHTRSLTYIAPEKLPVTQNVRIVFQPSIFGGVVDSMMHVKCLITWPSKKGSCEAAWRFISKESPRTKKKQCRYCTISGW